MLALVGCGDDPAPQAPAAAGGQPGAPTTAQAAPYPVTVRNCGVDYTYTKAPERVASASVPGTELILALGLQNRLAGVVGGPSVITPDLMPRMESVKVITERTFPSPSREALLSVNPDFLIAGYTEVFAPSAAGDRGELKAFGLNSYLVQGKCGEKSGGATRLEDTYADIESLGKIFNVPQEASALVARLKAEASAAQPATTKPKVLLYAAGAEKPSTSGANSLTSDLVVKAGGQNVLAEIPDFGVFNWETVVERNPDVILVITTGSFSLETATGFLTSYEPIAGVNAVKNRRFVTVAVNDVQPSPRNGRALATIAKGLAGG